MKRQREKIGLDSIPAFPRHVRLQFSGVRDAWAVLAPERVMWPDDTGLAILKRCNGEASVSEIVSGLCVEYDASRSDIEKDVVRFLQDWSDELLIRCEV